MICIIYGLKQVPYAWSLWITFQIVNEGLIKKNIKNYYLYYSINDGLYTIMLLYVDDLIIMGDNIKKKYNS